ncbi:MAG: MFS transporter [Gemmatales bacterium]|nr:MFS transporter [Gemmatales bacterium]MCS7159564.1 MFS transporter [Gemmatales bacterium]MDW8174762.1 MFS transporter [Gemmatales bacterium]MDW8223844.1 MFS transporter [Gemmatales bacterium]
MLQDTDGLESTTKGPPPITDTLAPATHTTHELAIVALSSLGHTLCHIGELAITGALTAIRRQFDLDPRLVTSLPYLGYVLLGLGAIPTGLAVDRWGSGRVLQWYFFALAVAATLVALANSPLALFIALTILGSVLSVYHPAGIALLASGVRRREWALGVNGVAGSIGVAVGPFLGALWTSLDYWQGAFWTIALISLLASCLMRPISKPLPMPSGSKSPQDWNSVWLSNRPLPWIAIALLYLCMILGGLNYRVLVTALPIHLTGDATQAQAFAKGGLFTFAVLLAGTIGQYGSGCLAQRFGPFPIYMLAVLLMAPLAACLASINHTVLTMAIAANLAVALFAQQPVENSLLAEGTSARRWGLSYGAKFALTFGIGALGAPLVGFIWHYTAKPSIAFWLITSFGLIMLAALGIFRYLRRRSLNV